jgi:uncharacterized protein
MNQSPPDPHDSSPSELQDAPNGATLSNPVRYLLAAIGILCLILSAVAAILPVLPVTPFLVVAAACFARSSRRFHDWLVGHRILGAPIRRWRRAGGMTIRAKAILIVSTLLITGGYVIFAVPWTTARILMSLFALAVIVFALRAPTARGDQNRK